MTTYITPAQLAEKPGAKEIAETATPAHEQIVDPVLMDQTLRGLSRTGWTAEQLLVADAALARVVSIAEEVDETIDAHIRKRVKEPLPIDTPSVLTRIARAYVRYELNKDLIHDDTHPVVRDYKDKRALLEAIRDGKVSLGVDDPATGSGAGTVHMSSNDRIFTRDSLRGL